MSAPALPAFWAMRRGLYAIVANDRDSCREKLQEFAEEKRQSVRLHNNTYPMRLVMRWPFNVVVCASGGGGNFQALIDKLPPFADAINRSTSYGGFVSLYLCNFTLKIAKHEANIFGHRHSEVCL